QAPGEAHRHSQGELVRRRDVDQARHRPAIHALVQLKTFSVHRHRTDFRAHRAKRVCRPWIPGIFHPYRIAGIQQQMGGTVERLLHPGDDQHLLGGTLHPAGCVQISGHRLPERAIAERVASGKKVGRSTAQPAGCHLRPEFHGKFIECGLIGAKGAQRTRGRPRNHAQPARVIREPDGMAASVLSRCLRLHLQELLGEGLADVGTRAYPPFDVPFGAQLLKRGHNRGSRELILRSQVASCREPGPRRNSSRQDRGAQLFVKPAIQMHPEGGLPQIQRQRARMLPHEMVCSEITKWLFAASHLYSRVRTYSRRNFMSQNNGHSSTSLRLKTGLAEMLKGGVIMDVTDAKQAEIAQEAGAVAVMALERVPAQIRAEGGVARTASPKKIGEVMATVDIPVMAKCRIGHFAEAQILQELGVDYIDESEVLTPADEAHHVDKHAFTVPFVCGARNLGEALRRIAEGAAMIRTKGEAGTGDVVHAVKHIRQIVLEMRTLTVLSEQELYAKAKEHQAPYELVQ